MKNCEVLNWQPCCWRVRLLFHEQNDTMLYWLAERLLLLKCYDNKMVKLPGCSSVEASSCSWPTKKIVRYFHQPLIWKALSTCVKNIIFHLLKNFTTISRVASRILKIYVLLFTSFLFRDLSFIISKLNELQLKNINGLPAKFLAWLIFIIQCICINSYWLIYVAIKSQQSNLDLKPQMTSIDHLKGSFNLVQSTSWTVIL